MRRRVPEVVVFLCPWTVGFVVLTLGPLLFSLGASLTRWEGDASSDGVRWVGGENYQAALGVEPSVAASDSDPWYWSTIGGRPRDPMVYTSLYNSLYYAILATPLNLLLSLLAALLLNRRLPGMAVLRGAVYLPYVLGGAATVLIWSWMLNPRFGSVNTVISAVGDFLDPAMYALLGIHTVDWTGPAWLYSPQWCKPAVILMHAWTMGGAMLVFLAALRRVPGRLHDAAKIDGAGSWKRFRTVTWPHITPAVLFNAVFSFVFAIQVFNESYLLEHRSQRDGLRFFVRHLFDVAFEAPYRWGYASALAWILFAVTAMVLLPVVIGSKRWVHDAMGEQ